MLAPTQHELLIAAVAGDRSALESVARAWWPEVRRWCLLQLGDPVLAEDASQEALVRLVRFIGQYDPERPFSPWIRHLARNACRDLAARQSRRAEREGALHDVPDTRDAERVLDLSRASRRALDAFGSLTTRQREVFDLCDRQGLDSTEASEALGIEASTVRVLLRQARRALRAHLLSGSPDVADLVRGS
ncbi:MAG: sigma-70 family RNA polymerase sigma factor [Alphaproteobacteria bacterium]|nr:sigma-70 family RNA polymerase sigma factor [Alphaproteobacteria bacterium]